MSNMIEKVKRIMELVLLLNPTDTKQGLTGNKPTIFVDFSGHCSLLNVRIYSKGWDSGAACDYNHYIMLDCNEAIKQIDDCIGHLESLYAEWKDKAIA